jgi:hypothetical protein
MRPRSLQVIRTRCRSQNLTATFSLKKSKIWLGDDPRLEYHLLPLVRTAVLTPLPSVWQECLDSTGRPYFYNASADESTRRYPVDSHFIPLINSMRGTGGSGGYPIMAFETRAELDEENSSWVYFDFRRDILLVKQPLDCPIGFEEQHARDDAAAAIIDLSADAEGNTTALPATAQSAPAAAKRPRALNRSTIS